MEIRPDDSAKQKILGIFPSEQAVFYALAILFAVFGSIVYFYRFFPVELSCTRLPPVALECRMERKIVFLGLPPVSIPEPLAADRSEYLDSGNRPRYSVEIRSKRYSHPIPLLFTFDEKTAQRVAKEINDFLLRSNQTSFHRIYP